MITETWNLLIEKWSFFLQLIFQHIQICAIAILIATILGLGLGILISQRKYLSKWVLGLASILYTIPSISLLGFLIPFTGIGNTTAIIALTIYALLPMVRNTYAGLNGVDSEYVEAARGMGSTEWQILYKIKLPLAFPVILAGLRNTVVMTIALAGIASFIGAGGLGVAIYRGITTNNAAMTLAGSILIAAMAFIADALFGLLEKPNKKKFIFASLIIIILVVSSFFNVYKPNNKVIHIATKPMTEQFILSEMLALLIEDNTDLTVEITKGVGGGTSNIHPAMLKGEFDMYPEYTGTGWSFVLKETGIPDEQTLYRELSQKYLDQYDMQWVGLYGFNNTYGLALRKEIAEKYNITKGSQLKNIAEKLIFGAEYDFFQREDGYDALVKAYDLNFKQTLDMDIGLKYQAINSGQIDSMLVFTTDGQLSNSDIVVIEDDLHVYQTYYCGTVVRSEILKQYPELKAVLMLMDNLISDQEMSNMNYQVEELKMNEKEVAYQFLIEKGLLK